MNRLTLIIYFQSKWKKLHLINLKRNHKGSILEKKNLRNLDDCFSSKTLNTDVATTNGKKIMKLNVAAATNVNKLYSLSNK